MINDICSTVSDNLEYLLSRRIINLEELELTVEHQGKHAIFLDLNVIIKDGMFADKPCNKRDNFQFFIVRIS